MIPTFLIYLWNVGLILLIFSEISHTSMTFCLAACLIEFSLSSYDSHYAHFMQRIDKNGEQSCLLIHVFQNLISQK
jgi:hypothetical protein